MTTVRGNQFAWIEAKLGEIEGVKEVARQQHRDPVLFPALHIFDGGQKALEWGGFETRFESRFTVEGYLEAADGAEAHDELSDLYANVVKALITEPPMGGLAESIDEIGMDVSVGPLFGKARLSFTLDFSITYATRRDDPSQAA